MQYSKEYKSFRAIRDGDEKSFFKNVVVFKDNLEKTSMWWSATDFDGARLTLLQTAVCPDNCFYLEFEIDPYLLLSSPGRYKMVEYLIDHGADTNIAFFVSDVGRVFAISLIEMATYKTDIEIVRLLLEKGDVSQEDLDNALIIACCSEYPSLEIANLLLNEGADPNLEKPIEDAGWFAQYSFRHYYGVGTVCAKDDVLPKGVKARAEKKKIIKLFE